MPPQYGAAHQLAHGPSSPRPVIGIRGHRTTRKIVTEIGQVDFSSAALHFHPVAGKGTAGASSGGH